MTYEFEGLYITTGGRILINAFLGYDNQFECVVTDEMGTYDKEFYDKYDFKKWLKSLQILQTIQVSERCF